MTRSRQPPTLVLFAAILFAANSACAATATGTAMPAWEQLTTAQREVLVAPIRERWNNSPHERSRTYERAQRWQQMTPEQRGRAHHGMRRWEHMDPQKREEMRALFQKMRTMTPEQRHALRDQWHAMTPGQREAWIDANPPTPR
ncbi:MAG: DUF3106 domain-containing protein [Luteimonas sp.]